MGTSADDEARRMLEEANEFFTRWAFTLAEYRDPELLAKARLEDRLIARFPLAFVTGEENDIAKEVAILVRRDGTGTGRWADGRPGVDEATQEAAQIIGVFEKGRPTRDDDFQAYMWLDVVPMSNGGARVMDAEWLARHRPPAAQESNKAMVRAPIPSVEEAVISMLEDGEQGELFDEMPEQPPTREEPKPDHRIRISYDRTTPESVDDGDFSESGWDDEEGVSMEPDEFDIEEGRDVIDKTVEFLRNEGASDDFGSGDDRSYGTAWNTVDYRTGEEERKGYHLSGYTDEEMDFVLALMSTDAWNLSKATVREPTLSKAIRSLQTGGSEFYQWPRAIGLARNPNMTPDLLQWLWDEVGKFVPGWGSGDFMQAILDNPKTSRDLAVKLVRRTIPDET